MQFRSHTQIVQPKRLQMRLKLLELPRRLISQKQRPRRRPRRQLQKQHFRRRMQPKRRQLRLQCTSLV